MKRKKQQDIKIYYVQNKQTGLVHDVAEGHFALTSQDYRVVTKEEAEAIWAEQGTGEAVDEESSPSSGRKTVSASKGKGD